MLMKESIPNSELLLVPNANHSVHLEKNEIVLKAIRKFLHDHSAAQSAVVRKQPDIRISIGKYQTFNGDFFGNLF